MASAFFKQFAIDNHLTIDYGYMYGKYRDFYISLKETLGSTKILYIITRIGTNKDDLKKVLSVFDEEELPKYCISDLKIQNNYLQFTFELSNDKSSLIIEFIDKFIESYINNDLIIETICPICNKTIFKDDNIAIVDIAGILTPTHIDCYEIGKEKVKKKVVEKEKELNKDTKGYLSGLLGAITFGLIYIFILILSFFFMQFILKNADSEDGFVAIFQYVPVLSALSACPLIYYGYDLFKGKKGTSKYLIILITVIVTTLFGTFFGFVFSLLILDTGNSFVELLDLVKKLIAAEEITGSVNFRWGFYLYIFVALGLSILSMVFKFSGKNEMEEANSNTFEKLD